MNALATKAPKIVVVGTSAGGLRALEAIVGSLPSTYPVPIVCVQHRSRESPDGFAKVLSTSSNLPIREIDDGLPLEAPGVYIAPPDYHVLVEPGSLALSTEEPVSFSRPSIDVLFESAADAYGASVLAVLLTGANSDGARGMVRVKAAGGIAIVQDPRTAESPDMPKAAIAAARVDRVVPLGQIADEMVRRLGVIDPVTNILLVDDEPANLLALEAILEPLGQRLVPASSAKEALRLALRMDFAVVVLDVQMPGIDGFECAELLRSRQRTRDVPIIFATAISKERDLVSRGYGVGAVDYLFKPYDPDVLRSKVAVFVELARKNTIIQEQHDTLQQMSAREIDEIRKWSERRYADLADAMPQYVWSADEDGRIGYVNERWRSVAGEGNHDLAAVVHPDDLGRLEAVRAAARADGREWEAEVRFGNAGVGYRFHVARGVPRKDEDGETRGFIGTGTDIDARVRAERALRTLAEASRHLAGVLDDPTQIDAVAQGLCPELAEAVLLDIAPVNGDPPRHVRALAVGLDEAMLDDPRFDLGPSTVRYSQRPEIFRDVVAELEETTSSRGAEHVRFLAELEVSAYMCLPLSLRGSSVGTLTLLRKSGRYEEDDVSLAGDLANRLAVAIENVRLHAASEKRRLELEQANKSKDVFLATLSHELRTPLNAIIGWTDMLRSGQLGPADVERAAQTIDRNAHALAGLVADLLDVSRIVTGSLKLESKLVGLASIVEAAVLAARPQCASKRVGLDVVLERVGCVRGDPGRLRQVLGNLLSNALKFTPSGGTITVRVEGAGARGRIIVRDTGEGIDAEFLPFVFERFRQAESARTRGLGLGLAIVKHLVEEHGGSVAVSSDGKGMGSTFVVELPIEVEDDEVDSEERSFAPTGQPHLAGVHVLVVEDDPDGNELITTILERYGARVTSVGTAAGALAALDAERPDVLVSDIGLPDADGMELVKQVRERATGRSLPAIALTAYASRQDAASALAAGFDAHVAKPVQPATLGAVIVRTLRREAPPRHPPAPAHAER